MQDFLDWARHSDALHAGILTFVSATLIWLLRARIVWSISHTHTYALPPSPAPGPVTAGPAPPLLVHTNEIWVQNVGRGVAEDIEVVLNFQPGHYDIWPQRQFAVHKNPDSTFIVRVENLNPREHFTLSMLQTTNQLPIVTNVRFRGGVGKNVPMGPMQIFSRPVYVAAAGFLILGFFAFWYFLAQLV